MCGQSLGQWRCKGVPTMHFFIIETWRRFAEPFTSTFKEEAQRYQRLYNKFSKDFKNEQVREKFERKISSNQCFRVYFFSPSSSQSSLSMRSK